MNDMQTASDLTFLALCVWREARGEPRTGKLAVAFSVMNRVRRPAWWGHTVLEVVFKKWQYSSLTDPKDVQLTKWPTSYDQSWIECLDVAKAAMFNTEMNPVPGADSYYDLSIPPPRWADPAKFVAQLGRIRFYNLDNDVEKENGPV